MDTRWGRFGILAANYFAPLTFGRLYPRSLLEAWRRIDGAILLFVYGKLANSLTPEEVRAYRLVGDEPAFPASSTISDWHRQGIEELAGLFATHEQALSEALNEPSPVLSEQPLTERKRSRGAGWLVFWLTILATMLVGIGLTAAKGYRMYQRLQTVRADVEQVQGLKLAALQPEALNQGGSLLDKTDRDVAALRAEAAPWLPITRQLGWVPVHGGDLAASADLLDLAAGAAQSAKQTYKTVLPIWSALHSKSDLKAEQLTKMLLDTRPKLLEAQATLGQAKDARGRIDAERLSPGTRRLVERLDPSMSTLDESLLMALAVPGLLGGTESGPKTYLILVENEDELRPTGGLISAVGKAVVWNGQLINLSIADSYSVDDINKAYPAAPWQLQQFMNLPIMTFHDTSWFTDYPTAVRWAEYLYAYTNSYSVDGVIAIDQNFMASLLAVTGPVYVPEIQETVTVENLRAVMRAQKIPPPPEQRDPDWHRKQFMNPIAGAILSRLTSGQGISWEALLRAVMRQLDQRHMLVQLDDPVLTKLIAERGWDGAVRSDGGDFLMVVDTNVGYNKTNAVVSPSITYDVNLTDVSAPSSALVVGYMNNAKGGDQGCEERLSTLDSALAEPWYVIDRCYYDYLRVYLPAGTEYLSGTPQAVSRDEMEYLEDDIPARVDTLDEEIANIQAFGTLLVVPTGETAQMSFDFKLPTSVVQAGAAANEKLYQLRIQKQAGQGAIPLILRVHLPAGSTVKSANQKFLQSGGDLLFNLSLATDIDIQVVFQP